MPLLSSRHAVTLAILKRAAISLLFDEQRHSRCEQFAVFKLRLKTFLRLTTFRLSLLSLLTNTLPGPSGSEVTTLWRYTNLFIIIIITRQSRDCNLNPGSSVPDSSRATMHLTAIE